MTEKNWYVAFSDSKIPEKVSRSEFLEVRFIARGLDAILSEFRGRSVTKLFVAFDRSYYNHFRSML